MEKTTLYLPAALQRSLRDEHKRSGRPQAELVREALAEYLAKRPPRSPRSIGIAARGGVPGRRAEAWVHRQWDRVGPSGRSRAR